MTYTYAEARTGSNWTKEYRPLRDIAADIRRDIKAAQKSGHIPTDVNVSVRCRDGLAIDVKLQGWTRDQLFAETDPYDFPQATEAAMAVVNRVEAIRESYNRDASDSMVDYFDVTFYGSTSWVIPN